MKRGMSKEKANATHANFRYSAAVATGQLVKVRVIVPDATHAAIKTIAVHTTLSNRLIIASNTSSR